MRLSDIVAHALEEDVGNGDITTNSTVSIDATAAARIVAKQELVVCGHAAAAEVFRQVGATYSPVVPEGERVSPMTSIAEISGPARAMLTGERLALNFLMRLCGIATHTNNHVRLAGEHLRVVDTRKTTPLMRSLERAAVRVGGGHNHRFALYDGILIKENHIMAAGSIAAAVEGARRAAHHLLRIEVEVETLAQLEEVIELGVDAALLDNMDNAKLEEAVRINQGRILLEASGNMTADRLPAISAMGIDIVSIGGLIHQATWADLSMRFIQ